MLAAGQLNNDVWPNPAGSAAVLSRVDAVGQTVECPLLGEVAVFDHPGELDDSLELKLAPPAANAGPLERIDQTGRLPSQLLAGRIEGSHLLYQVRTRFDSLALRLPNLSVDL